MVEISITDVERFIKDFREAVYPEHLEGLIGDYKRAQRKSRQTIPRYNIFHVLGIGYREVKTHSAFIADLLNPYGKHDHGFLFLKAFLEYCQSNLVTETGKSGAQNHKKFPQLSDNIEAHEWKISKEKSTKKHGRLDIVIQCEALNFLCVIENKVYAGESERQLKTYWEWMCMCNQNADYKALLFLTPKGRESNTAGNAPYYKLSYGDDIYNWLAQTLGDVKSPVLQALIQQYQQLALSLKGNS